MPPVTLEAKRLTKLYGARTAVDGLSFTARQGDVVGLLGPNGAGKTTTIRLLTTMLTPSAGEFTVAGVPGSRPAEIRRRVGVLPESAGYPGNQTGREYLRYHARLFGRPRAEAERVAARLLAEMGLASRAGSRIAGYSRGMRQRLGIARALVNDPAVVFLDEPTLGLDPVNRGRVWEFLERLAREEGMTLFLTTHYLEEAEPCDRVMIVDRGTVIAQGTPDELKRDLGGSESIELVMSDPDPRLLAEIAQRTGSEPRRTGAGVIVAVDSAEAILPLLLPLIGERLESLSVRKPTLDDVFVAATTPGGTTAGAGPARGTPAAA
jgi:ABC-2 type transport system ATP-binding protein